MMRRKIPIMAAVTGALSGGLLLLWFCFLVPVLSAQSIELKPPGVVIPRSLFGMHIHGAVVPRPSMKTPDPWPPIPFATWRLLAAYVDWPNLEPANGEWNFSALDKYISLAEQHNVQVLLPLVFSPRWASSRPDEKSSYAPGNAAPPLNLDDWKTYVRAVATRYKGRIHYYEIWNEPNLKDFFSGTPQQMVVLTREASRILKQVDPSITVVSPAATGGPGVPWLDQFLQNGGGDYVDVIGFHVYVTPNPPEQMVPLVQSIREVMQKHGIANRQLWDTESGWRIANHSTEVKPEGTGFSSKVLTADEASAYVARSYVLLWASGVSRFYWYAWDNGVMGLTEADGRTLKPPAIAYGEVENWLVGARMTSCGSDNAGTWTCQITRAGGYTGRIVWNPDRTADYPLQKAWGVRDGRELSGNRRSLAGVKSLEVGLMPVLLEKPAR